MNDNISNMERIGKNIQEARKNAKMNQTDLAKELNLTSSSVSNWEKGKSLPDIENLIELCKILRISSDEILGIETKNKSIHSSIEKSSHYSSYNNELEKDLLNKFRMLNKDNKYKAITNLINLLESQDNQSSTDKEKKNKGA